MADQDEPPNELELALPHLGDPRVAAYLGDLVCQLLRAAASATLYIDEQGAVRIANPLYVYLDPRVECAPERGYRLVRPIITDHRPRLAVLHEGQLWEVEPDEHEPEE